MNSVQRKLEEDPKFECWGTFCARVGIIDGDKLEALAETHGLDLEAACINDIEQGTFCACGKSSEALWQFCHDHPEYHVATMLDPLENSDKDDGSEVIITDNSMRYVDRCSYYLADGDSNPDLYHEEEMEFSD